MMMMMTTTTVIMMEAIGVDMHGQNEMDAHTHKAGKRRAGHLGQKKT
jgi:hypothetical protein